MTTRFDIPLTTPDGVIVVAVERKRVRNLNLRVRADGSVYLSIPMRARKADAQDFLMRRSGWIAQHVRARHERLGAAAEQKHDGRIPLWGKLVPLDEELDCAGIPHPGTAAETEALTAALYRHELARALPDVTCRAERLMGVAATSWQVRAMTSRWGSCTPARRTIRINANLAAYPPACLEFVVVHELVHLIEPSHNARFHMLLDCYCPENRELARTLKRPAREVAGQAAMRA